MTVLNQRTAPRDRSKIFNRLLYGGFVLMSIYFLVTNQLESTMTNLGIALIFDPFDQKVMWNNRSLYQRIWLLVHVSVVLGLMSFLIFQYFIR
jgi:hypothetical protein